MQPIPHLIIVGRDGILNEFRTDHIKAPEEWLPVPGALEALCRLNHAGWHVVVATNQSGIGRGMIDMSAVNAVHARMHQLLQSHGTVLGLFLGYQHLNWPEKANAQSADMVRQVPGTVVHRDLGELATHLLERAHLRDSQSGALD